MQSPSQHSFTLPFRWALILAAFLCNSALARDFKQSENYKSLVEIIQRKQLLDKSISFQDLALELLAEYQNKFNNTIPNNIHISITNALSKFANNPNLAIMSNDSLDPVEASAIELEIFRLIESNKKLKKTCHPSQITTQIADIDSEISEITHFHSSGDNVDKSPQKRSFILLENKTGKGTAPRNFRTTLNPTVSDPENENLAPFGDKDIQQLQSLNTSGSGQPSQNELIDLAQHQYKDKNVILVDLRLETHVFLDGRPFSQQSNFNGLNWGKSEQLVRHQEEQYAQQLTNLHIVQISKVNKEDKTKNGKKTKIIDEWKINENKIEIQKAQTEEDLVEQVNKMIQNPQSKSHYKYVRIVNPDLHRFRDNSVDRIVDLVTHARSALAKERSCQEKDVILHFHCKAGRGRTTTAMVMVDILNHYSSTSVDQIMSRQHKLGGKNLDARNNVAKDESSIWAKERDTFVRNFYQYCVEQGPFGFKLKWAEWLKIHPTAAAQTSH